MARIAIYTIVVAMAATAFAGFAEGPYKGAGYGDYYAHPKYSYNYGVHDGHTGDFKTAHETRDGGVTKGSYSVLQPDGILRVVNYVVDPVGGFRAEVVNKGVAHHAGGKGGLGYPGRR